MRLCSLILGQFHYNLPSKNVSQKLFFCRYIIYFKKNCFFTVLNMFLGQSISTEFAAFELVDKIVSNMNKIETPITILLDVSKAFDIIDLEILLYKLKYYGFNYNTINLMKSYLTDHKQFFQMIHSLTFPI